MGGLIYFFLNTGLTVLAIEGIKHVAGKILPASVLAKFSKGDKPDTAGQPNDTVKDKLAVPSNQDKALNSAAKTPGFFAKAFGHLKGFTGFMWNNDVRVLRYAGRTGIVGLGASALYLVYTALTNDPKLTSPAAKQTFGDALKPIQALLAPDKGTTDRRTDPSSLSTQSGLVALSATSGMSAQQLAVLQASAVLRSAGLTSVPGYMGAVVAKMDLPINDLRALAAGGHNLADARVTKLSAGIASVAEIASKLAIILGALQATTPITREQVTKISAELKKNGATDEQIKAFLLAVATEAKAAHLNTGTLGTVKKIMENIIVVAASQAKAPADTATLENSVRTLRMTTGL